MSQVAVAGLLTVLVSFLDVKNSEPLSLSLHVPSRLFKKVKATSPRSLLMLSPVSPAVILGKSHYILYGLVAAMQPRMLVTFDEELRPLPVSVRVGQVRPPSLPR